MRKALLARKFLPICSCLALLSCLLLGACPAPRNTDAPKGASASEIHFLVTVKPLELIIREVAGERATVSTLLKAGNNSHTFDPSPADAKAVQEASGFFWVGEDYDGWAAQFDTPNSVELLTLIPAEKLSPLPPHGEWRLAATPAKSGVAGDAHGGHDHTDEAGHVEEHGHLEGHGHIEEHEDPASTAEPDTHDLDHEHAEGAVPDPHFYTDPLLVQALLPALVERLSEIDPGGSAVYSANAAAFGTELAALDRELQARFARLYGTPVLMFHPSFVYFIRRYGLVYGGSIEPYPGSEPSPRYLQQIVEQLRAAGARAVFSETLLPAAPAQAVAEAAGIPVVELDPACGNSGRSYKDYRDWLLYNAGLIETALAPAATAKAGAATK